MFFQPYRLWKSGPQSGLTNSIREPGVPDVIALRAWASRNLDLSKHCIARK